MTDFDLAPVLITMDRSPGENYLGATLENLLRSDLATSRRTGPLMIVDSAPGAWSRDVAQEAFRGSGVGWSVLSPGERRCANLNVAAALRAGARTGAPWVLFLEDDIDVCADFFEGAAAWLDAQAEREVPIYPLGANYTGVEAAARYGAEVWVYPLNQFYGTQAVAIRASEAESLAAYLEEHCYDETPDGTAYDLLMAAWARARGVPHLLTPAPSFVEHIGGTSSIRPRPNVHRFPSWRGRDWSPLNQAGRRRRRA